MTFTDFHWFSFTVFKEMDCKELKDFIHTQLGVAFEAFTLVAKYRYGYSRFYSLDNMVNIYIGGTSDTNNNTTHIEIKGTAWDTLPELDYNKLIQYVADNNARISRIDLYIDDCNNILDFNTLITSSKTPAYNNRLIMFSKNNPKITESDSRTIEYGSKASDVQIQVYEKGIHEKVDFPQTRFELRLKNAYDICHIVNDIKSGMSLGDIAKALLYKKLDFKIDGPGAKARRATESWWLEFLSEIKKSEHARPVIRRDAEAERANFVRYIERYLKKYGTSGREQLKSLAMAA